MVRKTNIGIDTCVATHVSAKEVKCQGSQGNAYHLTSVQPQVPSPGSANRAQLP